MKFCTKCGVMKDLSEFNKSKSNKGNYQYWCKSCIKEYYEENKERIEKYRKKQELVESGFKEYSNKTCPKYKQEKDVSEFYYESKWSKNHDCCIKCGTTLTPHEAKGLCDICYNQEWYWPPERKLHSRKKRASKFGVDFWTPFDEILWRLKLNLTKGYCPNCGKFIGIDKLTLDHIIPLTPQLRCPQGFHIGWNTMPLCGSCNSSKNNMSLYSFYMSHKKGGE